MTAEASVEFVPDQKWWAGALLFVALVSALITSLLDDTWEPFVWLLLSFYIVHQTLYPDFEDKTAPNVRPMLFLCRVSSLVVAIASRFDPRATRSMAKTLLALYGVFLFSDVNASKEKKDVVKKD
jgi:hypothetical protein